MTIDKQALRERYSEKPAPKCHICRAVMTIQRAGSGGVVYGCTGRIDKDGEGYKFETGRDFADDHYARSRVTDYSPSGDPDVLALLDELEAAEKRIAEQREYYESVIADGSMRIASLDDRTLTVKLPQRATVGKYVDEEFNNSDLAAIYNSCRLECEVKFKDACAAAGIKLQIEGE
ncbi:ead/Ea22-like family protein [Salmonella enterica]|uniref:ead/Ea22-like family protein n=1 Tax=Salmonella enterica TaxID=28901 RepID=UPI0009AD8878|nr:ead/Ea22-like family protein [Salmonella enterica]EDV3755312.1 ead/Ea22-like family protein [Salmonella enterica subsp. enterica]EAS1718269.1 ead/Ea22-like family protein [Salmonella enterica]EAW9177630.1 ead/Ea22-like family protein [Salmonella enterica]EAX8697441.1 ead/Ea22-like family protein [Salmonella enterica]EAX9528120.1 ead/Ea22-like family protein [Salmonella enterica]